MINHETGYCQFFLAFCFTYLRVFKSLKITTKILSGFTMCKVKSKMVTKDFVIANDWKLTDIREDTF